MRVEIRVTEEHIKNGRASSFCGCPIALATCEAMGLTLAWVQIRSICFDPWEESGWSPPISLPDNARDFILRFDEGRPVEPFTFAIDVPGRHATETIPA